MKRRTRQIVSLLLSFAIFAINLPLPAFAAAGTVGYIYTVAEGGDLNSPFDVAVDSAGNLIIADYYNHRIRVVAAVTARKWGVDLMVGNVYTVAGTGASGYSGDGGQATSAQLAGPSNVALDGNDNIYIADSNNNRVRVVAAADVLVGDSPWGMAMTAGYIYTVAGGGSAGLGDGDSAKAAELFGPNAVALDSSDNLYIADTWNNRIRVVAAKSETRCGIAMEAGNIYTVAGGADGISLSQPYGIAINKDTDILYISDTGHYRILGLPVSAEAGSVSIVAGDGGGGYDGDGGPAVEAGIGASEAMMLFGPHGVDVDAAGNIYIADSANSCIREVAAATGTQWGIDMTAGNIYTVAGTGEPGYSGDGGHATAAQIKYATGVAVGIHDDLYIADFSNDVIRNGCIRSHYRFTYFPDCRRLIGARWCSRINDLSKLFCGFTDRFVGNFFAFISRGMVCKEAFQISRPRY
jgi:sugar lactone lactonase YvrE